MNYEWVRVWRLQELTAAHSHCSGPLCSYLLLCTLSPDLKSFVSTKMYLKCTIRKHNETSLCECPCKVTHTTMTITVQWIFSKRLRTYLHTTVHRRGSQKCQSKNNRSLVISLVVPQSGIWAINRTDHCLSPRQMMARSARLSSLPVLSTALPVVMVADGTRGERATQLQSVSLTALSSADFAADT